MVAQPDDISDIDNWMIEKYSTTNHTKKLSVKTGFANIFLRPSSIEEKDREVVSY